jgi:exonuclease SbcD
LGDIHLGANSVIGRTNVGSAFNSRVVDQSNLLDWVLEQAIDNHISHLILTGDVFDDPKPHPALITLFISWIRKCQLNKIALHIIMGNHDILRTGRFYTSPLDIISECELSNVFVYQTIDTFMLDNSSITFVPFRDRKSFEVDSNAIALELLKNDIAYELASIPITHNKLLVGHLAIEGSIPVGDEIDDLANEIFCPFDMFSGYDYVWMGHVHKYQVMNKKPYIAHIGSMDLSNFGETDQKKYLILIDTENNISINQIEIPVRPLRKFSIVIPKNTSDPTAYVLQELSPYKMDKAIVKVDIQMEAPDLLDVNRETVEKFLRTKYVFGIANISQSRKMDQIKSEEATKAISATLDVSSAIKLYAETYLEEAKKQGFISLASQIYNQFLSE